MDMNFHIRVNARDKGHVHFSVLANGAYCGRLTMTVEEFETFKALLTHSSRTAVQVQFTEAPDET